VSGLSAEELLEASAYASAKGTSLLVFIASWPIACDDVGDRDLLIAKLEARKSDCGSSIVTSLLAGDFHPFFFQGEGRR